MLTWHIITGEYPPVIGGVSDYSQVVAEGLAATGDDVHVWCPPLPGSAAPNGVTVHPMLGHISRRDLRAVDLLLDRFPPPRRLLLQWVPQGFGYRSLNVGFCLWLRRRARRGDHVEIMVHEPYLAFGEGALRWTAAAVGSSSDDGHSGSRGRPHLDRDSGLGAAMAPVRARPRRAVRMAADSKQSG